MSQNGRTSLARKVLIWTGAALTVLAVVAGLIILWAGNPNNYKNRLARAFQEATGRAIVLEGDLRLSVYPWLGVRTGPLKVANASGFTPEWFLTAQDAVIRIKLLPFLTSKRIETDMISLDGLELYLSRDEHGTTNLQDLTDRFGGKTPGPDSGKGGQASPGVIAAPLLVQGLIVKRAMVVWEDRMTGRGLRLTSLDLQTGILTSGRPVGFSMNGDVAMAKPELHGPLKLSAEVTAGKEPGSVLAKHLTFGTTLAGAGLPVPSLPISATADLALYPEGGGRRFELTGLDISALNLTATGEAHGTWAKDGSVASGSLVVKEFSPEKLLITLGRSPRPARDPQVLKKASISAEFMVHNKQVQLPRLEIALDDTRIKGWLGLGLAGTRPRPTISFDLAVDGLDLDRYLPPQEPAKDAKKEPPLPAMPVAVARHADLDGLFRIGRLVVHNLVLTNVLAKADARDTVLRLDPLTASLYGGSLKTSASFSESGSGTDAQTAPASGRNGNHPGGLRSDIDLTLDRVQVEPLLVALADQNRLGGTATVKAKLALTVPESGKGNGNGNGIPLRTLNGQTDLNVRDGFIRGFSMARDKTNGGGPQSFVGPDKQTAFSAMTGSASIRNGVAHNRDFRFTTRDYTATGEGTIDLADKTLDYTLYLDFTALPRIPVQLTGPLNKPHVAVNRGQLLTGTAWGLLRLPFSIGEGLLNGITGGLQGLFEGLSGQ